MVYNPQVANPFFVAPPDFATPLAGLGQSLQSFGEARGKREQEQAHQAKIKEAARLNQSGDRKALADFFIANPDIHKEMMEPFKFQSEETRKNFFQSTLKMRDAIATDPHNRERLQSVVDERNATLDRWGVPESQRVDTNEFLAPGGTYDQLLEADPTGQEAIDYLEDITARGAPDLWKEYDATRADRDMAGKTTGTYNDYLTDVERGWTPPEGTPRGHEYLEWERQRAGGKRADVKWQKMGSPIRLRDDEGNVYEQQTWVNPANPSETKVVASDPITPEEAALVGETGLTTEEEARQKMAIAVEQAGAEADIRVEEARGKVIAQGQGKRRASAIDDAITAADNMAGLRRAIALTEQVETGGFAYVMNGMQKILGTQSADQGELDNLMSQSFLQQLKPIFGAQFTKAEGDLLRKIEANFQKNGRVNSVLMKKALRMLELRVAKGRAMASLEGQEDKEALALINAGYNFRFDDYTYDETGERIIVEEEGPTREKPVVLPDGTKIIGIKRK
jgi:hypothetical protein